MLSMVSLGGLYGIQVQMLKLRHAEQRSLPLQRWIAASALMPSRRFDMVSLCLVDSDVIAPLRRGVVL
jgi:hypothetical protein